MGVCAFIATIAVASTAAMTIAINIAVATIAATIATDIAVTITAMTVVARAAIFGATMVYATSVLPSAFQIKSRGRIHCRIKGFLMFLKYSINREACLPKLIENK